MNNMIFKVEDSASCRHISLKILEKFLKILERLSFELGKQKSPFRISMETPVEHPLMTIDATHLSARREPPRRIMGRRGMEKWSNAAGF